MRADPLGWSSGEARTDVSEGMTAIAEANAVAPFGPNLVELIWLLERSSVARLLLSFRPIERASTPLSPRLLSPSDKDVNEALTKCEH